jgi:lipoyl-dependent peroxiredoxin
MTIATRTAQTAWEGPLASGTGLIRMGSGAADELADSRGGPGRLDHDGGGAGPADDPAAAERIAQPWPP